MTPDDIQELLAYEQANRGHFPLLEAQFSTRAGVIPSRRPVMTDRRLAGSCALPIAFAVWAAASGSPSAQRAAAPADGSPRAQSWTLDRHLELVRTIRTHLGVDDGYEPPRTAWGHPDFEGAWTSDAVHGVPRDRPAQFGDRMETTNLTDRTSIGANGNGLRHSADSASRNTSPACRTTSSSTT
jgi:hypothetical protein